MAMHRPEDAARVVSSLLRAYPSSRVFTFNGPMGVGKTTLIKAICTALGVEDGMSSPSFALVNEYRTKAGAPVYHFDLYRLNKVDELEGIGFTEYLDSGHYCMVEWPGLGAGLYPSGTIGVELLFSKGTGRTVTFAERLVETPPA